MKVAVLYGGRSFERSVSLRSGGRVEEALYQLGHETVMIDADGSTARRLAELRPDCAFIALHGKGGEDGSIQELLELLGIPYTGSGPHASYRANNKALTKRSLRAADIPTPQFVSLTSSALQDYGAADVLGLVGEQLGFPLVVKPASGGSALGIRFAPSAEDVPKALVTALSYDQHVLLERYVEGRELSIAVVGSGAAAEPLPLVHVQPRHSDFYDFESRYTHGECEFDCPADIDESSAQRVREIALATYRELGLAGVGRVDVILDDDGTPWVLEVNSIPGLTETSLLPMAWEAAGNELPALVDHLLADALDRAPTASTR